MASILIIEHDCPQPLGLVYGYYGHVLSDRVEGQSVEAGDIIGTIKDWGGNSHLHFGMNRDLIEDNWGLMPPGTSLREIQSLGWLDPLPYLTPSPPPAVKPAAPVYRPAVRKPPPSQKRRN